MSQPAVPPPLKPRPRLLIVLLTVFFLWIGALLWMYFATVYPHRDATPRPVAARDQ